MNSGFKGTPNELIAQIRDSTGGFTLVLAGLKAYLEHNIKLNLISDRFPKELGEHGFEMNTTKQLAKAWRFRMRAAKERISNLLEKLKNKNRGIN